MSLSRAFSTVVPRLLAVLAVAALALGAQLHASGTALADGTCAPYQNGLSTYQNQGCVYNFGNTPPYSKNSGDFVYINYMIDGGFPTNIYNDIQAAVNNWSNSGANIRFTQNYYYNGQSNFLEYTPSTSGANFSSDCNNSAWGQSWAGPGTNTPYHQVLLNSNLFNQTCVNWDGDWTGIAVHESGHAMGMAHNGYCSYCGTSYAMNARMNVNAVHLLDPPSSGTSSGTRTSMVYPQVTDTWIFNQIYSNGPIMCASQRSNFWCNGMDPSQQNCTSAAANNQHVGTPYGWVEIWYSSSCTANWTKAASYSGWAIYRVQIKRSSGTDGGAITIEDAPNATNWYTNMVYSPNNTDQSCVSFINTSNGLISQWYCTGWH